jgi:hypothetical protein
VTTLRREQQGEPKLSVLPSATVAAPFQIAPCLAAPHLARPCHDHPLKRAAEGARAPCAAVCSYSPTAPVRSLPNQAMPSLLSKESSRGNRNSLCCRLQLSPSRILPCTATTHRAEAYRDHSPKRAAGKACALRAAVCSYCLAIPRLARPSGTSPGIT